MNLYCLIKESDLIQEHINFSTSSKKETMPIRTSTEYILWIFPLTTSYYVVEFIMEQIHDTGVFHRVRWFSKLEMQDIIDKIGQGLTLSFVSKLEKEFKTLVV